MDIVFLDHHTLNSDGLDIGMLHHLGNVSLYSRTDPDNVLERCKNASVVITNKVKFREEHFQQLPNLKYIVVAATGYNNIDVEAAASRGIPVSNVRGYSTESVVQHTFSLIFGLLNKVESYGIKVSAGAWQRSPDFAFYDHSIREINGRNLGVIGYGTIGRRVAEVAVAFGMQVLAYQRTSRELGLPNQKMVDLDKLFTESDIITCHAPLNEDSYHMISEASINKMKRSCIIINTARGGLVQDEDLARALKEGRIAGAGIDTLAEEPPKDNPLIKAPNCIITPHQAWTSLEARKKLLEGILLNIQSFQKGKLLNVVNKT